MTQPARVALVTGAGRGIGKAIALRLARDGRHVVLVGRSPGPLSEVKALAEDAGGLATLRTADVGKGAELTAVIDAVASDLGRLDILVNNAGITKDMLALRLSDEDWNEVIRVNLTSAFVAIRAAARHMMRARFGRIINIGSTSGLVGNAGQANYAAAKAGLVGLTKTIARELGAKGITCNLVAPGYIQTDMTHSLPDEIKQKVLDMTAVRRLGTPDDIAAGVAYVASDEAGFLTGQVLTIDGGMTMC